MSDTKEKKDNLITVYKAAQSLGIKAEVLQYQIDAGNIDSVEGMVYESVCDKISEQQATYIGIKAFLQNHNSDRLCEFGHEWRTEVYNRSRIGLGCPYCSGKRKIEK